MQGLGLSAPIAALDEEDGTQAPGLRDAGSWLEDLGLGAGLRV